MVTIRVRQNWKECLILTTADLLERAEQQHHQQSRQSPHSSRRDFTQRDGAEERREESSAGWLTSTSSFIQCGSRITSWQKSPNELMFSAFLSSSATVTSFLFSNTNTTSVWKNNLNVFQTFSESAPRDRPEKKLFLKVVCKSVCYLFCWISLKNKLTHPSEWTLLNNDKN